MHLETVLTQMRHMRLSAMADSLQHRLANGDHKDLSHEEFISLLVNDEHSARHTRKLTRMIGRANLKPEQAWSYEAGLNWSKEWLNGKITLFQRNGEQLIDWVRDSPEMVWQSRNIANVNTNGVEIAIDLKTDIGGKNFALSQIRSSYVFLNSNREKSSLESKYILNYLRHKLLLNIEINAFNNIYQNFSCRYEDRVSYKDLFLLDSKTSWKFRKINFFLELTNILDTTYVEAGFVPMPGRWAMLGFELNFNN